MKTPSTQAGRVTERIMAGIHQHIIPGGLNPGEVPHYNRAYEHVYAVLSEVLGPTRGLDDALNRGDGSYRP